MRIDNKYSVLSEPEFDNTANARPTPIFPISVPIINLSIVKCHRGGYRPLRNHWMVDYVPLKLSIIYSKRSRLINHHSGAARPNKVHHIAPSKRIFWTPFTKWLIIKCRNQLSGLKWLNEIPFCLKTDYTEISITFTLAIRRKQSICDLLSDWLLIGMINYQYCQNNTLVCLVLSKQTRLETSKPLVYIWINPTPDVSHILVLQLISTIDFDTEGSTN